MNELTETKAKIRSFAVGRNVAISVGVVVTIGYVFAVVYLKGLTWVEIKALNLNELGDFLSGSFAPLAFWWFLIALFLQSIELKQNTQALQIQGEEMRNAVEQASKQADELERTGEYQRQNLILMVEERGLAELSSICCEILRIVGPGYFPPEREFAYWQQYSNGDRDIFFRLLMESPGERGEDFDAKILRWFKTVTNLDFYYRKYCNRIESYFSDLKKLGFDEKKLEQRESHLSYFVYLAFQAALYEGL